MSGPRHDELVLAIYPFTRGLAFALFESPLSPVDWGVKDIRSVRKNALALEAAEQLIERLQPDVLVLEDFSGKSSDKGERVRRLQQLIANFAAGEAIEVHRYSRKHIRECFKPVGAVTRYEIAQAIASRIHAFGHRLPPVRKIWKSEAARMGLFDAAALALTFYCRDAGHFDDETAL